MWRGDAAGGDLQGVVPCTERHHLATFFSPKFLSPASRFLSLHAFSNRAAHSRVHAVVDGVPAFWLDPRLRLGKAVEAAGSTQLFHLNDFGIQRIYNHRFGWVIIAEAGESAETENISSGGCALTEATEDVVNATGPSPAFAEITATPPGCMRNNILQSSASMAPALYSRLGRRQAPRAALRHRRSTH